MIKIGDKFKDGKTGKVFTVTVNASTMKKHSGPAWRELSMGRVPEIIEAWGYYEFSCDIKVFEIYGSFGMEVAEVITKR